MQTLHETILTEATYAEAGVYWRECPGACNALVTKYHDGRVDVFYCAPGLWADMAMSNAQLSVTAARYRGVAV